MTIRKLNKLASSFDLGMISHEIQGVNRSAWKQLLAIDLESKGFEVIQQRGFWHYKNKLESEVSFLVIDTNKKGNLKQVLCDIGHDLAQEAVIFKPKRKEAVLIDTESKSFKEQVIGSIKRGKNKACGWSKIGFTNYCFK